MILKTRRIEYFFESFLLVGFVVMYRWVVPFLTWVLSSNKSHWAVWNCFTITGSQKLPQFLFPLRLCKWVPLFHFFSNVNFLVSFFFEKFTHPFFSFFLQSPNKKFSVFSFRINLCQNLPRCTNSQIEWKKIISFQVFTDKVSSRNDHVPSTIYILHNLECTVPSKVVFYQDSLDLSRSNLYPKK